MSADEAEDGSGGGKAAGDDDLSARLRRLEAQLERQRPSAASDDVSRPDRFEGVSPLGQAMRLSSEFVAGVVVGGVLGWVFDYFLNTKPWGLMAFLLLGFVTGIYNVMRSSGFIRKAAGKNGQEGS